MAAHDSGGAFDPTLVFEGYQQVKLDASSSTITLQAENLILDLGGIGKGFALDRAAAVLEAHGLHCALLDFGGQLLALDPPPGQLAWEVGIFDPRSYGTLLGSMPLVRASVATRLRLRTWRSHRRSSQGRGRSGFSLDDDFCQ